MISFRRLAALGTALAAALALGACGGAAANSGVAADLTTTTYAVGHRSAAPGISGVSLLDGSGTFNLATLRGHVVVLNFWASWCAPCRAEAADLEAVYKSAGVDFVGVNTEDQKDGASAFVSSHGITYPNVFDPSGDVMLQFRSVPPSDIPSTIVLDASGRIAAIHLDAITPAELNTMIKAAQSS